MSIRQERLRVVVVNYKSASMAIQAVNALMTDIGGWPNARLTIVDNHSEDDSIAVFEKEFEKAPWRQKLTLIASERNGGYGAGNNLGLRADLESDVPSDYFYLLNPDAFVTPGAVGKLVEFLAQNRHAGIAGSFIEGVDGVPHHTAFRFPSIGSEIESGVRLGVISKYLSDWIVPLEIPETRCRVDWLAGASMMIRREVLETVGLFDEKFFLYFEETDLCLRAVKAGFPTYYIRDSVVVHVGSATTGMKDTNRRVPTYWMDSRHHYFEKHFGKSYARASDLAFAIARGTWEIRRRLQRKTDDGPPGVWIDFVRHSVARLRKP
jgi:N-acetylglucosaminyl-diphospho-decaprenol L-rhamnosyltransferase